MNIDPFDNIPSALGLIKRLIGVHICIPKAFLNHNWCLHNYLPWQQQRSFLGHSVFCTVALALKDLVFRASHDRICQTFAYASGSSLGEKQYSTFASVGLSDLSTIMP